jgi:hypothetical protein
MMVDHYLPANTKQHAPAHPSPGLRPQVFPHMCVCMCGRLPVYGRLPIHGESPHIWEGFPQMGSLPVHMGRLPVYGEAPSCPPVGLPIGSIHPPSVDSPIWECTLPGGDSPMGSVHFPLQPRLGLLCCCLCVVLLLLFFVCLVVVFVCVCVIVVVGCLFITCLVF